MATISLTLPEYSIPSTINIQPLNSYGVVYTVHFLYILLLSINITLQEAYGCKQLRDVCFTAYLVFQVAGGVYCTPSRLITGCHCSLWLARVITLHHAYRQVYPPEVYTKNYTNSHTLFVFCCGLGLQGFHCAPNCIDNILGHLTIAIQIQIPSVESVTFFFFFKCVIVFDFTHILQDCFTGTGAIIRLPQCQWNNLEKYG